jgi:hypothetical protein
LLCTPWTSSTSDDRRQMRANDIAWSPLEPTTFALASEDHNVYTFE